MLSLKKKNSSGNKFPPRGYLSFPCLSKSVDSNWPRSQSPSPAVTPPAAAGLGDPLLDPLELRDPTRQRDHPGVIEPVNLLGLPQELPKQRVIEVYHRNDDPASVLRRPAADVHSEVPHRHVAAGNGFALSKPDVATIFRAEAAQSIGSTREVPAETEDLRRRRGEGPAGRVVSVPPRLRHPPEELHQLPPNSESSLSTYHSPLCRQRPILLFEILGLAYFCYWQKKSEADWNWISSET